ncbi:aminoglycoside phosphotransferase family protein [Microbacterium sp. 179-B 1A2 NHS]|uniref:aminoglycoside phosphotransferase family protein n=1 Tax=Microbacterium sp. 179-B 1A2 NHS TaxID=3142383 RepID=UPI0039A338F1
MPQPGAELDITVADVERLVGTQHPALRASVRRAASGWDNDVFRLGEDLAVRLPRRQAAVPLIEHEQRWLADIAARMPVDLPVPVAVGRPDPGFPWPWSIVPWFEGTVAATVSASERNGIARQLADALRALHVPAPIDAPRNPVRGVPLADRAAAVEPRFAAFPELRGLWRAGLAAPSWPHPPVWVHGDVHPGNIVVRDGRVRALLDFGDMCAGDPACDLAIAWLGFTADGRDVFQRSLADAYDSHVWTRARAWAAAIAALLADADDAWLRAMSAAAVAELTAR